MLKLYFVLTAPEEALTSDLIWRELELTKKVKPIVVSMVIMPLRADTILRVTPILFCPNNTITGSEFWNIT
jgi:protease-4